MSDVARPPAALDDGRLWFDDEWTERLRRRRVAVATRPDGGIVLLRPDSVLAKAPDDDEVERLLPDAGRAGLRIGGGDVRRIGDYVRLDVDPAVDEHDGRRWSVRPVASSMRALADRGWRLKPNHVYLASGLAGALFDHPSAMANPSLPPRSRIRSTARPAVPIVMPQPLSLADRRPPRVLVLDTGMRTTSTHGARVVEHPALRPNIVLPPDWRAAHDPRSVDDDDEWNADGDDELDLCAGHGTFISGIVLRGCPDASVHVRGVLTSFGDGDDDSIEAGLRRALATSTDTPFDVIVLSLEAVTGDDRFPPLAAAVRRVASNGRTVVVAAAGNGATARPTWPAAIPEVVGVGAVHGSQRAWFSNFGGWVDACAPGVDVVSTFFCDAEDRDGDRVTRFDGWAAWNGTSFAAPIVAAAIAQDMYLHGDTAPEAWRRLSDWRRPRVPDLGVIVPG